MGVTNVKPGFCLEFTPSLDLKMWFFPFSWWINTRGKLFRNRAPTFISCSGFDQFYCIYCS